MQEQPKQELSLETPEEAAARANLGAPVAPPSVMDNVRAAQSSGDPVAIETATVAADEKYMSAGNKPSDKVAKKEEVGQVQETVEPLHDEHVNDRFDDMISKRDVRWVKEDLNDTNKYNSDVDYRLQKRMEYLGIASNSQISGLIDKLRLKIDVLADEDPLSFGRDLISKIADDLVARNSGLSKDVVIKQQSELYLDRVKDVFKSKGYNPKIIDVLASEETKEQKVLKLKPLV